MKLDQGPISPVVLLIAILIVGSVGYLVGKTQAATQGDFEAAQREAQAAAFQSARSIWYQRASARGVRVGRRLASREGRTAGTSQGSSDADAALGPSLEYTSSLPNGQPGYLLPEGDRSLSCVGYEASTGQCVGD